MSVSVASSGFARRMVSQIALGCLLGAATVGVTTFVSTAPASASCSTHHANVVAYDAAGDRYGNGGYEYVNTSSVINSLQNSLYRSLFIYSDSKNWVEIGWGAGPNNITGQSGPTVYAFWENAGSPGWKAYSSLNENSNYPFLLENAGHIEIFRYYFNGEPSPFAYSPTMNFNIGAALANSEHYNSCDSLYTHMYDLSYFNSSGSWSSSYGDLACYEDTSINDWYLHKNSNSDISVTQSSSGALSCPS